MLFLEDSSETLTMDSAIHDRACVQRNTPVNWAFFPLAVQAILIPLGYRIFGEYDLGVRSYRAYTSPCILVYASKVAVLVQDDLRISYIIPEQSTLDLFIRVLEMFVPIQHKRSYST